jgi:hypothetical protein
LPDRVELSPAPNAAIDGLGLTVVERVIPNCLYKDAEGAVAPLAIAAVKDGIDDPVEAAV